MEARGESRKWLVVLAATLGAISLVPRTASAQDECANVLVVFDRSSSMTRVLGDSTRWDVAVEAVRQIVTDYSAGVRFGLALFPGDTEEEECAARCEPGDIVVDVGSDTGDEILAALAASPQCSTTPIGATLEVVVDYMPLRDEDRENYVLLVTDGADSCVLGDEVVAARDLLAWGVLTYAIGFGEVDTAQVNAIADAGGTDEAHLADDADSLQAAFDRILGALYRDPEFGCVRKGGDSDSDTDGDTDADSDADGDADGGKKDEGCGCRTAGGTPGSGILLALPAAWLARRRRR